MKKKSKSKDTVPELLVRRVLRSWGYGYRLHDSRLPGTPDIVFPKERIAVFIHGCFWHQHGDCDFPKTSQIPREWRSKFKSTNIRDLNNLEKLRNLKWTPLVLWECKILKSPKIEAERITTHVELERRKKSKL